MPTRSEISKGPGLQMVYQLVQVVVRWLLVQEVVLVQLAQVARPRGPAIAVWPRVLVTGAHHSKDQLAAWDHLLEIVVVLLVRPVLMYRQCRTVMACQQPESPAAGSPLDVVVDRCRQDLHHRTCWRSGRSRSSSWRPRRHLSCRATPDLHVGADMGTVLVEAAWRLPTRAGSPTPRAWDRGTCP